MTTNSNNEKGSVLLYILVAIALLAALSYVVTRGNRGSVKMITDEQARLAANEIIEYGNTIANAVQKLRLRGCSDTEIGFSNNIWSYENGTLIHATGHNPSTPGNECEVFKPEGGNVSAKTMPSNNNFAIAPTAVDKGNGIINSVDVINVGTTEDDLVLFIYFVPKESCAAINSRLNTFSAGTLPADGWAGAGIFNGTYTGTAQIGDEETGIAGKTAGCLIWPSGGYGENDVHFYQVLLAR